jgi:hypothetical protein
MTLRWLSSMVGGRVVKSVRQKVAPQAQRELGAAIDADAIGVRRVMLRDVAIDPSSDSGEVEHTAIVRVDARWQPAIDQWLNGTDADRAALDVRTDWIFFPATPEAVLMGVAEDAASGEARFRFNLRFSADEYRRHLERLAETGLLGLTTVPLQIDDRRRLASPCVFVALQVEPLRAFLREIPKAPVV